MITYKVLKNNIFEVNNFKITPIRYQDRYVIMNWRNDQIKHLRQEKVLTKEKQDEYFKKIIEPQFQESNPSQILFSFLKEDIFICY
jgi:hypothetical protein